MDDRILQSAKRGKKRTGQKHLINHLQGGQLTRKQAIYANCYSCNGMGEENTCDIIECPLYPHSQYSLKGVWSYRYMFYGQKMAKKRIVERYPIATEKTLKYRKPMKRSGRIFRDMKLIYAQLRGEG